MEFYDLRSMGEAGARPTIRTTGKSVMITIPNHLAQSAGLPDSGRVRLRIGESGKHRAVRISRSDSGVWSVTRRRNVLQIFVRELMPKGAVQLTDLDFRITEDGLEVSLPSPWELANPHVVVRSGTGAGKPAQRQRSC